jgi:hypothetical protein
MKIDIYDSVMDTDKHLAVPAGTDVSTIAKRADFDCDLLDVKINKTIDIQPGEHRVAIDSDDVIRQIREKGYAEFYTKITVTIGSKH